MNRIPWKWPLWGASALVGAAFGNVLGTALIEHRKLMAKTYSIREDNLDEQKKTRRKKLKRWSNKIVDGQYDEAIRKADEVVRRFKVKRGVPGVSVGVSVDGKVVWKAGYGYADIEKLQACTPDSVMRIASISKPLTMTIAAKLMQDNQLDIDAPIQKYVPSFPEKEVDGEKVTITTRHLVSHMGGIRHYEKPAENSKVTTTPDATANQTTTEAKDSKPATSPIEELVSSTQKTLCSKCQGPLIEAGQQQRTESEFALGEYYNQKQYTSVEEALSMFKDDPLVGKPGTKYKYTTHGWTLVSAVIEGASGRKFPELLKDLFVKFGMRETYLDENGPLIPNRASYYRRSGKSMQLENVPSVNNSYKLAGGGVLSTVGDLLSFANSMLYFYQSCPAGARRTDCFLDRKTLDTIWTPVDKAGPPNAQYAMGWSLAPDRTIFGDGQFYVCHSGGAIGATSTLLLKPAKNAAETGSGGVAVAILTNVQECGGLGELAYTLAGIFDRYRQR